MRTLVVVAAALVAAGCQSAEDRKIEALVERTFSQTDFQIAELGEPFVYRAPNDARMACVTFKRINQWGEVQPEQRMIATYSPSRDDWFMNSFAPADDGLSCEEYVDPNRIAAQQASDEAARQAQSDERTRRQTEEAARWQEDLARREQAQSEDHERQQQEFKAAEAVRTQEGEVDFQRRQREADAALQRSLETWPVSE